MKTKFGSVLVFIGMAAGLLSSHHSSLAQSYLDTRARSISGPYTTIRGEAGSSKIIVLDFWTTWCKPCLKVIPKLVVLSDKYKDQGVMFLGINSDGPKNVAKVKPLATNLGINYPVLLDTDQEISNELLVTAFPTLILLDSKGKVIYTHQGYTPGDEAIIEAEIRKGLGLDGE